ncbi:MAG: hypothetical protein ABEJ02_00545 [Candidatus Paceibacteria bacterium]
MSERDFSDRGNKETKASPTSEFIDLDTEKVQDFLDESNLEQEREKEIRKLIQKGAKIPPIIWDQNFSKFFEEGEDLRVSSSLSKKEFLQKLDEAHQNLSDKASKKEVEYQQKKMKKLIQATNILKKLLQYYGKSITSQFFDIMKDEGTRKERIKEGEENNYWSDETLKIDLL